MNIISRTPRSGAPIDLGAEAAFRLGTLRIEPSSRQVIAGGRSLTVEPRVMQVLVALARADGRVVSRDQLIERCWGGRIVGDDAVNSCIAKVRALATLGGESAFEIETVPRVGYRLNAREYAPAAGSIAAAAGAVPDNAVPAPAFPAATVAPLSGRTLAWAAGAGLCMVAAAFALYLQQPRSRHWVVVESHQPFISTPLIERYPALSPDGTMLAYSAGPTVETRHIFLRFLKGGESLQLTHDSFDAASPAWSPDGRTIAYVLFQNGRPCRIMEIPVPGGGSRTLGHCRVVERSSIGWDGSGNALYYSDKLARSVPERIFRLDVQTGRVYPVTSPPQSAIGDYSPSASPDGRSLLYARAIGGERIQIRVHSLTAGSDRLLAGFDDGDDNAAWSTDGQTIFIARWRSDQTSIWAYPSGGGNPEPVTAGNGFIGRISTAANGLMATEIFAGNVKFASVLPGSAAPPALVDNSGIQPWALDYAADGTLLLMGHLGSVPAIWIAEPGHALRELVPLTKPHNGWLRWSPDGTRFAYVQQMPGGYDVPVIARSGAPLATLHFAAKDSGLLEWTADGRSIITSRHETKGWRLWRTDVADPNRSAPLSDYGWKDPRVLGSMLFAARSGTPGVWRIDGKPRRITAGPPDEESYAYAIAGHDIVYYDDSDPSHPVLSARNIDGGAARTFVAPPAPGAGQDFAINPKSGAVVFLYGEGNDTDIGLIRLVRQ